MHNSDTVKVIMEIISQKPDDKNKGGNPESHQEAVAD
jgi:hypothetical protein